MSNLRILLSGTYDTVVFEADIFLFPFPFQQRVSHFSLSLLQNQDLPQGNKQASSVLHPLRVLVVEYTLDANDRNR